MTDNQKGERIRNPFISREREFLRSLSAYAKDNNLLSGYQRKVLYEGGHYNYVFIDRLARINEALSEIEEDLSTNDEQYAYEIRAKGYRLFLSVTAEQGQAFSQFLLGYAYYHGMYGLTEDVDEGLKWLRLAAEQGQDDAMLSLGQHLLLPGDDSEASVNSDVLTEAVKWLTTAVQGKNYEAAYHLGTFYLDQDHDQFDATLGLKYLRLAARNDDADAQADLGLLYEEGEHVRRNYKTAVRWYTKACEGDNPYGLLRLGICHQEGRGVEVDDERAYQLYEQASENGSDYAAVKLGQCRRFGIGYAEDDELAFEQFTDAAENHVLVAYYWLGISYFYGEGTLQNYGEALANFEISSSSVPRAYYFIGELKRKGLGCRQDTRAAFESFLEAAEHGIAYAKTALGRAFYFGEGVKADYVEAVKWLELGVEEEDSEAMYLLGMCHIAGDGVPENRKVGLKLLHQSAGMGNGNAKKELEEMGFEVPQDANCDGNVEHVGDQLLHMARAAYQRLAPSKNEHEGNRRGVSVLKFPASSTDRLESVMREHADGTNSENP